MTTFSYCKGEKYVKLHSTETYLSRKTYLSEAKTWLHSRA